MSCCCCCKDNMTDYVIRGRLCHCSCTDDSRRDCRTHYSEQCSQCALSILKRLNSVVPNYIHLIWCLHASNWILSLANLIARDCCLPLLLCTAIAFFPCFQIDNLCIQIDVSNHPFSILILILLFSPNGDQWVTRVACLLRPFWQFFSPLQSDY